MARKKKKSSSKSKKSYRGAKPVARKAKPSRGRSVLKAKSAGRKIRAVKRPKRR